VLCCSFPCSTSSAYQVCASSGGEAIPRPRIALKRNAVRCRVVVVAHVARRPRDIPADQLLDRFLHDSRDAWVLKITLLYTTFEIVAAGLAIYVVLKIDRFQFLATGLVQS